MSDTGYDGDRKKDQRIGYITLVVRDYDEAIAYYTDVMDFDLIEDTALSEVKRWVLVAPPGTGGPCLLLAKAVTPQQVARIGDQTGGRVSLFLHTDDFWRDYEALRSRGVVFEGLPRNETYGTVAVFRDLYGNRWDLLQLTRPPEAKLSPTRVAAHRRRAAPARSRKQL